MNVWMKLLGTPDWPVPDAWIHERSELLSSVRFGGDKPPMDVAAGDRLVYYAVGWQRFFAIAEVISEHPYEATITDEWNARWPWVVDVRILQKKRRLIEAPSVLELGQIPDRRHQSYVPLTRSQLELAERLLG
jgi:EVE domain